MGQLAKIIRHDSKEFMQKVCAMLIKQSKPESKLSLEKRFLSLMLLKNLMLEDFDDRVALTPVKQKTKRPTIDLLDQEQGKPVVARGDETEPKQKSPPTRGKKQTRTNRSVSRKATHMLMKGVDFLRQRNNYNRVS